MKRIITIFGVITMFGGSLFAQSFAFFRHDVQLENNAEITATEFDPEGIEWGSYIIQSEVELKNLTTDEIATTLTQTVLEQPTAPGKLEVCFGGSCRMPTNEDVTFYGNVESGFHGGFHFAFRDLTLGEYTRIKVQYDVYPTDDPDDKTTLIIIYDYSEVGIKELSRNDNVFVYSQNGRINFKFNKFSSDMQLVMYNITGREIGTYNINSEKFVLPETLSKGIYIYSLKEKGKVTCSGKYVQK